MPTSYLAFRCQHLSSLGRLKFHLVETTPDIADARNLPFLSEIAGMPCSYQIRTICVIRPPQLSFLAPQGLSFQLNVTQPLRPLPFIPTESVLSPICSTQSGGGHCALVTTISHKEGGRSFPIPKTPGQSNSQFRQGVSRQPTPPTSPLLP